MSILLGIVWCSFNVESINNGTFFRFFFNFGISQARLILEKQLKTFGLQLPPNQPLSSMLK